MKALIAVLLIALPIAAHAAAPEDAYIAARDKAIARFKNAKVSEATARQIEQARKDLVKMLGGLVGHVSIAGLPAEGELNLESLSSGDIGFGQLDGLIYQKGEDDPRLLVTTPSLAMRWLALRKRVNDKDLPRDLNAALKSDGFYTLAFSNDSAAYNFVDVPVTKPGNATFAVAMLQSRQQDVSLPLPAYLVVAVVQADRVYVWTVPAKDMKPIAACDEIFNKAGDKLNTMIAAYQRSGKRTDKALGAAEHALDVADGETRKCYGVQAKDQPFFADVVKDAQELVDRLN